MQIRPVRPGDEAQLADLLEDHERHYGDPVRPGSGAKGAEFLVKGGTLTGFAILNPYFPAMGLTHGMFLKELYVAASARARRVIWTTGTGNTGAQRFYDRLGIRRIDKVYYAMDI